MLVCVCIYMCESTHIGQKSVLEPLELDLEAVVSCLIWVLGPELCPLKEQKCSEMLKRVLSLSHTSFLMEVLKL